MKKIALILALAMGVSLAACATAPETPEDPDTQPEIIETEDETEGEAPVEKEKVAPTLGTLTIPNKYANSFIGITAQFPSTGDGKWVCNTNEQNLTENGFTKAADGKYENQLKKADYALDFYAVHSKKDYVASVVIDNLSVPESAGSVTAQAGDISFEIPAVTKDMSEDDYIETTMSALTTSMASQGIIVSKIETAEVTFAESQRKAIVVEGTRNGTKVYQKQVIFKIDDYMIIVTASTTGEKDETDSVLNQFKLLV